MVEKIVITGLGTINSLGSNTRETWENAKSGVSGVGYITQFDTSDSQVKFACEVKDFQPDRYLPAREVRRRDRYELLATIAAQEAIQHSGLEVNSDAAGRVGVIVSSAIGGLHSFEEATRTVYQEGSRRISPFLIPMLMSNGAAGLIAIDFGFRGPCLSIASACASGADGIGMAWLLLRSGIIDVALAGGSEATISKVGVAAFDRVGAMSRKDQQPWQTPQPFDRNRDGLVMGEGAAVLIMERESHARARGAVILAELAGYAATADAFHVTAPAENGEGGSRAILQALQSAEINLDEVGYINAHGTGTPLNDLAETRAIKSAFHSYSHQIPVSSTKSMTGHMMGATGALEAIFCVQALREQIIPPTINYQTPDPDCDLDYVPNIARQKQFKVAISNAFGFGGHNAVLVIREYN
jgi:beta-ketoacyl-acyl-carrier-protein synthase II